jgi:class 3 adenylate cyclase
MGLHTGEVERRGDDLSGVGVHLAARLLGICEPDELLVTRTVKDLVTGSGIIFEDRGVHAFKGLADDWQVFRVIRA